MYNSIDILSFAREYRLEDKKNVDLSYNFPIINVHVSRKRIKINFNRR